MLSAVAAIVLAVPPPPRFPPCDEGDLSDVETIAVTAAVREALAAHKDLGDRGSSAEVVRGVAADVTGDDVLDLVVVVRVPAGDAGPHGTLRAALRAQQGRLTADDLAPLPEEGVSAFFFAGRHRLAGEKRPSAFVAVRSSEPGGAERFELWGFTAVKGKIALVHALALGEADREQHCSRTFGCWASARGGEVLLLRGRGACAGPERALHAALPKGAAESASILVVGGLKDVEEARKRYRQIGVVPAETSPERPFVTTNGDLAFTLDRPLPRCDELLAVFPAAIFPGQKGPHLLAQGPFLDPRKAAAAARKLKAADAEAQLRTVPLARP